MEELSEEAVRLGVSLKQGLGGGHFSLDDAGLMWNPWEGDEKTWAPLRERE